MTTTIDFDFDEIEIVDLVAMPPAIRDELSFGVIGFGRDGLAQVYNATESRFAGLPPGAVIGKAFFEEVAQCMNNFMVAQRFIDVAELDEVVPFVLTLRMRPTPVRLRLLASASQPLQFILIER